MIEPMKEEAPPLLGSWKRIYAVLLAVLILLILVFRLYSWISS